MSWLERMFGGHHGGQNRGGHDRGHGGSHGGSHGGYGDDRTRQSNEGWGRVPNATPAPPGVNCPKCGAANAAGSRFCGQCASSLAPQACSTCKQALAPGAKFCSQCGAPASA
ncbi:zinc ribbon domain-containing protein [Caballeronia sp. NK8]|uniref:zinc ribbon domain-containing protein n=1 Tax=Caballeronia sp. NK8 TaxID=140098 RepID=UPI001BCC046D